MIQSCRRLLRTAHFRSQCNFTPIAKKTVASGPSIINHNLRSYFPPPTSDQKEPDVEEPSEQVRRLASEISSDKKATSSSTSSKIPAVDEAKFIFNQTWVKLETKLGGRHKLRLPSEIIWLMGAPGSGKGTTAPAICQARGITNPPISISRLLKDESTKNLVDCGQMVGDQLVLQVLIKALLECDAKVGVLVDGFPRTAIQVECLKLLYDKLYELHYEFAQDEMLKEQFGRPVFRITVLYVDEAESVRRQLKRGHQVKEHNEIVRQTGQGELLKERITDSDENLIRARYKVFQQHIGSIMRLKKLFPFHLINAFGSIDDVVRKIRHEFEYQSSLELDEDTFNAIQHIPIADKIGIHARQELVRRLENYQANESETVGRLVKLIETDFVPAIRRHSISGYTNVRLAGCTFKNENHEVEIVMDILSERGYRVSAENRIFSVPVRVDPGTMEIISEKKSVWIFGVEFPRHLIRSVYGDEYYQKSAFDVTNTERE